MGDTLDPVWKESFIIMFKGKIESIVNHDLELEIRDKDKIGDGDFLGCISFTGTYLKAILGQNMHPDVLPENKERTINRKKKEEEEKRRISEEEAIRQALRNKKKTKFDEEEEALMARMKEMWSNEELFTQNKTQYRRAAYKKFRNNFDKTEIQTLAIMKGDKPRTRAQQKIRNVIIINSLTREMKPLC